MILYITGLTRFAWPPSLSLFSSWPLHCLLLHVIELHRQFRVLSLILLVHWHSHIYRSLAPQIREHSLYEPRYELLIDLQLVFVFLWFGVVSRQPCKKLKLVVWYEARPLRVWLESCRFVIEDVGPNIKAQKPGLLYLDRVLHLLILSKQVCDLFPKHRPDWLHLVAKFFQVLLFFGSLQVFFNEHVDHLIDKVIEEWIIYLLLSSLGCWLRRWRNIAVRTIH